MINKNKDIKKTFFVIFIAIFMFLPIVFAQEINPCEEISLSFNEEVSDSLIINQAIDCNMKISNEQFKLASEEMKEKYILSDKVDFSFEEQNSFFINTILKNETEIDESKKEVIKAFFIFHENYSIINEKTNKSAGDVFEKVANKSIATINEINQDGQNNIAIQRYLNTASNFLQVSSSFKYYDYENKFFITEGAQSTKFTTNEIKYLELEGFSDFYIENDGRVKAKNYKGKEICIDCNYYISPDGKKINVQSGELNLDNKRFASDKPFIVNVKDKSTYEVIGSNIIGIDPENSETIFNANGKITILSEENYLIGENTKYTQYLNNNPLFDVETEKETNYYSNKNTKLKPISCTLTTIGSEMGDVCKQEKSESIFSNPCEDESIKTSCIYFNTLLGNNINVKVNDNDLIIKDTTNSITDIKVAEINNANSKVLYKNEYGLITFDKYSVNERGSHEHLPSYYAEVEMEDKQYTILSDKRGVEICQGEGTENICSPELKGMINPITRTQIYSQGAFYSFDYSLDYNTLKNQVEDSFGARPILFVSMLKKPENKELLDDLVKYADKAGVDRELFIATYMQEGGIMLLLDRPTDELGNSFYQKKYLMDNYGAIGADTLIIDQPKLIRQKLLPSNFMTICRTPGNDYIVETRNEAGLIVKKSDFYAECIIQGMAALVKDKTNYASTINNEVIPAYSQLSKEDQWFIQYAAYNWGQGNVNNFLLKQNNVDELRAWIHKYNSKNPSAIIEDILIYDDNGSHPSGKTMFIPISAAANINFNAGRVVGGAILLKQSKLLDQYGPPPVN